MKTQTYCGNCSRRIGLSLTSDGLAITKRGRRPSRSHLSGTPGTTVGSRGPHYVYGFSEWPKNQPARIPREKPCAGNSDAAGVARRAFDQLRKRSRQTRPRIRERLLGQAVLDLPIGVAAQIPDEPHHTLRDRMEVTREAKCWKCHQWMDELGLPFEQFTHYGVFREAELVEDPEASRKESYKESRSRSSAPRS